jgi:hypothetical protein
MFNKFGDSVAQIAQKTKSLAAEALEAIDAPEEPTNAMTRRASAPPEAVGDPSNNKQLVRLIEAVSGSCDASNLSEEVSVILTQIDLVREQAFGSKFLSLDQKEIASTGSLITFLDSVLAAKLTDDSHAASALLEALEQEQEEHVKTKNRLSAEVERLKSELNASENERNAQIKSLNETGEILKESLEFAQDENRKLHVMVEKLVSEKSALELDRDDSDKVDGAMIRSAFISLCLNMNEKSIRDGILRVMSEMLHLSPEETQRCGNVLKDERVLANEFLKFLEEEVGPTSQN